MISVGSQSLQDKFNALRYFVSGQGLSFVVLKATTSELMGPKKKHLTYLTNITHEPNVSIPNMAKYLMQRARQQEWPVVFKALMTIHYLMSYGNEKFIQNLASSAINQKFLDQISLFSDKSSNKAYDMSTFIRRYSRYIAAKVYAYKSLGVDFCRINAQNKEVTGRKDLTRGKSYFDDELNDNEDDKQDGCVTLADERPASGFKMKTMPQDRLLATLPVLQNLFDLLMAFDASVKDLNNGIINTAFSMLYKDFVKLYITYQTAIIRLLDLYFKCKQAKQAQGMLEAYRKFLVRMDKVSDFMFVVDAVGMDKSDMPNVSRSPNLSLKLMEKHLELLSSSANTLKRNQENQSLSVANQTSLARGQSFDLPRIDYDYGTYNSRRRRSLRRSTTTTPTKPPASSNPPAGPVFQQQEAQRAHFRLEASLIHDALAEEEEAVSKAKTGQQSSATNVILEKNCDSGAEEQVAGPGKEERKDLLLMGDSQDLEADRSGSFVVASRPSEWIRVDF